MSTTGIVLLVLTVLTWVVLALDLSTVIGADGTGDRDIFLGLRWLLAGVLIGVLWLWLGGLLLMAGGQGLLSKGVSRAALILGPVSAASAFGGLYLSSQLAVRWPMAVIMAIPPLLAGYVFSLYLPHLRTMAASPAWASVTWGLVLILSCTVWPAVAQRLHDRAEDRAANDQESRSASAQERERKYAGNRTKLQAMTPDQHLVEWYSLLDPDSGVRPEALEVLKTVERRQGDMEEGLNYGIPAIMKLVPELDLKYTPELCQAGQAYLTKTAKALLSESRETSPYPADVGVELAFPGVEWFVAHGCNCEPGLSAIETSARSYRDSPDRQKLLTALSALRPRH